MTYVKQEWKDEVLNGAEKYKITRSDGTILADNVSVELITQILQAGTPITAERMNHIEDGIANCADKIHATTHALNGSDPITPESIGAMSKYPPSIELSGHVGGGGYIDFHFNGDMAVDYTARIGEFSRGTVVVAGNLVVNEYISAKNINDSGWIDMGLANGWSRISGGIARFRKWNNVTYVIGQLYGGAATSPAFVQLPSGFRPHVRMEYACTRDDNTTITGVIGSDGIMWFTTTTYGTMIQFSGSWIAEV